MERKVRVKVRKKLVWAERISEMRASGGWA